jgi:phosphoenolpyruvate synthase/pyruvate phosphate dikinase
MSLEKIKRINWIYTIYRPRTPLLNSFIFSGIPNRYENKIAIDYVFKNLAYINGHWYADEDKNQQVVNDIDKALNKDPLFIYKISREQEKIWQAFERELKSYKKINFSELSNKELKKYFNRVSEFSSAWISVNLWFLWLSERLYEKRIKNIIKEKVGREDLKIFSALTSPSRKGFFEKEGIKIAEIALKIKRGELKLTDKKAKIMIKKHLEGFAWLKNSDFKSIFWKEKDIIKRIKELINKSIEELKRLSSNKEEHDIRKLLKSLKLSKTQLDIVKATREMVYFRTFRTDIQGITGYHANQLFKEISKRMNVSFEDFHYFFHNEINQFLETEKLDKKAALKRKNTYAVIIVDKKINYFDSEREINKLKEIFKEEKVEKTNIIKGNVANPGKAKGIVRIINDVRDMKKIKEGNILATLMTKPKYISAMERASAFVTDEGGILCHAAIISREMNKPCIIGTKIATKVLKDGD